MFRVIMNGIEMPKTATAISGSLFPMEDSLMRHFLSVVNLSYGGHEVNEHGADIKSFSPAQFTGGVILREGVVVVVVAFAHRAKRYKRVLTRVNVLVIWLVSPHVGSTVHTPGSIQKQHVTKGGAAEECRTEAGVPEIPWYKSRKYVAHEYGEERKIVSLEYQYRIGIEVTVVEGFTLPLHLWMFSGQQPTDVSEKEAPLGIVRVTMRLRIFVMNSVVTCPFYDVILRCHGVEGG